ncbi:M4 family metallopeptidase [Nocardioides sp. B-3]|uniref:M4 family metallopeptidase n=1 Tax=Nocardioides sp. B-3 TaxID=2895565 RepID=UPI002152CEEC|nr:M4 family metallopeptidase [Nocardioides sp. B-3]UUZ58962.1 M4 family metallopeptidase [Nocardioides sp. B-3]
MRRACGASRVGDGRGVRRLVLVDDTTGRVVLHLDRIQHVDRVVCDSSNVYGDPTPCAAPFARTETGPVSAVADVNKAFDHAGSTSSTYAQIAGIDLTDTIGINVGGVKKLASTVRFCHPDDPCPMANAFWNGTQMYYGAGFADADDVVGHEMTHGVIDQYSELFYWGQSGAINESMADIMGEIVDHRAGHVAADDARLLGEDLPIGAIRDMKDPVAFGDPDRMTSANYTANLSYNDNGGVHSNSGVGNKTAYLISRGTRGGTFNGQTITGIDASDTGLTKTGKLYFDAITRLTSGSDYADLAAVLEQSCADFVVAGTAGFTAGDCANVAKAVLATELRTTPPAAPQPSDAVKACPTGTTLRELFNSETGTPATKFSDTTGLWGYGVNPGWGSNATSGRDSWLGYNPDPGLYDDPTSASLRAAAGIAVPAGQQTYLHFQQWRLFEWYPGGAAPYIDGGTVEVVAGAGPVDAAGLPWINGPQQTLQAYGPSDPNPWAGLRAFAGDSFGWTSNQLDLSSFAGQTIRPQFTVRGDLTTSEIGWWLDDIVVYTCDASTQPTPTPTTTAPTTAPTATNPPAPTVPPAPPVVQQVSTTKVTVGKVRPGRSVKIKAIVKIATGVPTGRVTFKIDGKKVVKTRDIANGKAILKLSRKLQFKLGRGKHRVKAIYTGSPTAMTSTGKTSFNLR